LHIISRNPFIMVDGAHNVDGMKALAEYMKTVKNRKVLMLGIAEDKEAEEMVKIIVPLFEQVIVTEGNYKPMDAEQLARIVKKYRPVKAIKDSRKAFEKAKELQGNDMLLITGSLYLLGDVLPVMKKETIAAQQSF
ncbi:MAG TPA: cyanophycin synthetase, partial [Candidatus Nanoarchaeia archaeon]|nr:cyanophycin synthetase [Candidatus Nanoarchaeia archaeon]